MTESHIARVGRGRAIADLCEVHDETFDVVCAFEVLEHIEDDAEALKEWRKHLRPQGWVLLSVPAHERRFGPCDEFAGHFRRYEQPSIRAALTGGGFDLVSIRSYGVGLGQALEWTRHRIAARRLSSIHIEERTAASGRFLQPKSRIAALGTAAVAAPFRVLQTPWANSDIGIGYVVLARAS
jgi:hypothetical protein